LPGTLGRELEGLAPNATSQQLSTLRTSAPYLSFVEEIQATIYEKPACVAAEEAGRRHGWSHKEIGTNLKTSLWCQDVDADLSRRTNLAAPLKRGGRRQRAELRRVLMGDALED
jgi:hypothetical protein